MQPAFAFLMLFLRPAIPVTAHICFPVAHLVAQQRRHARFQVFLWPRLVPPISSRTWCLRIMNQMELAESPEGLNRLVMVGRSPAH